MKITIHGEREDTHVTLIPREGCYTFTESFAYVNPSVLADFEMGARIYTLEQMKGDQE